MSTLWVYAQIGFRHIVSPDALDHILFLVALAAIYRPRDWRPALAVVSAFTVGHSITLALAATNILRLSPSIVEFLIPVTIAATGVENLAHRARLARGEHTRSRPVFAVIFGLVHGAGFAEYLRQLFVDDLTMPLLGFNVGIEAGQVLVLVVVGTMLVVADRLLTHIVARGTAPVLSLPVRERTAFSYRLVTVSCLVSVVAVGIAVTRVPWS